MILHVVSTEPGVTVPHATIIRLTRLAAKLKVSIRIEPSKNYPEDSDEPPIISHAP